MKKQKSNFFKKLMTDKQVKKFEVVAQKITKEKVLFTISRESFEEYYMDSDDDNLSNTSEWLEELERKDKTSGEWLVAELPL